MKSYFGYVRVSTARQGEGVSLDEQRRAIEAHARANALSISRWFEEKDSASKRGRRVFNQMVAELEGGHAAGVVIHKIDRSARHLADWVWVGELIDRGVDVRFAHENLDLSTRSGRLTGDMLAVIAADYSRNLRDEVKKGLYGRLKQGIYPFKAPMGYLDRGGGKPKAIDPSVGPLVRLAFELYASGRYSVETLRHELARRRLHQRSGQPLTPGQLDKLLNNPFYIGLIRISATGEMFDGSHAPLVSKQIFDRVHRILNDRSNTKLQLHDFMLRLSLRCSACGRTLTGERQKGRVYYRCHSRPCRGVAIREDKALNALRSFHELIRFPAAELRELSAFVERTNLGAAAQQTAERARLGRAIVECDERLARLTDAVVDLVIDRDAYAARKEAVLLERRRLLDELERPEQPTKPASMLEKFEQANTAYLGLHSLLGEEIRSALRITTSNLTVEGKRLLIQPQFPYSEVARKRLTDECGHFYYDLRTNGSIVLPEDEVSIPERWSKSAIDLCGALMAPDDLVSDDGHCTSPISPTSPTSPPSPQSPKIMTPR
jgi:DNA invertase Pin-like site-specific DNA recombinase